MSQPVTEYTQDTYQFSYQVEGIQVRVERMRGERGDVFADVTTFYDSLEGALTLIHSARLPMGSDTQRTAFVRELVRRTTNAAAPLDALRTVDFDSILEEVCYHTRERHRLDEPLVDLAAVDYNQRPTYLLKGLVLDGAPTLLFGRGGLGKSIVALGVALSLSSGNDFLGVTPTRVCKVLYLDWEWSAEVHAARLAALCAAAGTTPPRGGIYYRHMVSPFVEAAPGIRRDLAETGAELLIIDSMGLARGGEVKEDGATNDVFRALRSFGVASLITDHIAKGTDAEGPIGSVYSTNGARLLWRLGGVRLDDAENGTHTLLSLTNTKTNGRLLPTRGIELHVVSDSDDIPMRIRLSATDPEAHPELRDQLDRRGQICSVLKESGRMMTAEEIRDELLADGIKVTTGEVLAELRRGRMTFVSKPSPGGEAKFAQWGLRSRQG